MAAIEIVSFGPLVYPERRSFLVFHSLLFATTLLKTRIADKQFIKYVITGYSDGNLDTIG